MVTPHPKNDSRLLLQSALTKHRQGDLAGAAPLYRQILAQDPQNADAYQLLGVLAQQLGKLELARELLEQAVALQPQHAPALTNLSLLLRQQGAMDEALRRAQAAVTVDPTYADAHSALGGLLAARRDYTGALRHLRRALVWQPENAALLNDIANAERRRGDLIAAFAAITQALALQPQQAMLHHTHGNILRGAGYPDLASAAFMRAFHLDPTQIESRQNAALCHLLLGDFAVGWQLYAERGLPSARTTGLKPWDGKSAGGLLIQAEQGLGDTLQCVRYASEAHSVAGQVVLEVQPPLLKFMRHTFPDLTMITPDDALPPALQYHCRMLDLPPWFGMLVAPYLTAPVDTALKARVRSMPTPRFGLVWGGNPGHLNDANRSVALAELLPVLHPWLAHGLSLQKGPQQVELAGSGITDGGAWCQDFAATAALVVQLDVVISVDTSVAHLAGAMGKPVWLLLPYDPDWRWLLQRRDTPWYPTMKLYRQRRPQDWSSPLAELQGDLAALMAGDRGVLQPPPWGGAPASRPEQPVLVPGLD